MWKFGLRWVAPKADPKQGLRCRWFIRAVITGAQRAIGKHQSQLQAGLSTLQCWGWKLRPRSFSASISLIGEERKAGGGRRALLLVCSYLLAVLPHPGSGSSFPEQLKPVLSFSNICRSSLATVSSGVWVFQGGPAYQGHSCSTSGQAGELGGWCPLPGTPLPFDKPPSPSCRC